MGSLAPMAYASTVGMIFIVVVLTSLFIGGLLDKKLGTGNVFSLVFVFLGLVASFYNMYMMIKKHFRDEIEIIKSVRSEAHRKRPAPNKN
ncbi:MAG: AtpZ/AtpI family protein [Deltaproteobacteria bacterium]|nr:AtpZ/AtpI family protein [Deltaproteobacteria bacterium]